MTKNNKKTGKNAKKTTKIAYPQQKIEILQQKNAPTQSVQTSSFGESLFEENQKIKQQIDELESQKSLGLLGGQSVDTSTLQPKLTAGANVTISDNNVISSTNTTYTAGQNVTISDQNVISATNTEYVAGNNILIANGVISATDTTYTAGQNITITNGVISATSGLSQVTASDVDSESATSGQVLTANGTGGASWQNATGSDTTALQNQVAQNTSDIQYLQNYVVRPDAYYSGQTAEQYPAGTIFQTYDDIEESIELTTNNTITIPTIYFCAEQNSGAMIKVELRFYAKTTSFPVAISIYVNGTSQSVEQVEVETANQQIIYQKTLYGLQLNENARANNVEIRIGFASSTSGTNKVLVCTKYAVEIVAPNAEILAKPCPYCVVAVDGTYHFANTSSGSLKVAQQSRENMFNVNNLVWQDKNIACNNAELVVWTDYYNGVYNISDVGLLYRKKDLTYSLSFPNLPLEYNFASGYKKLHAKLQLSNNYIYFNSLTTSKIETLLFKKTNNSISTITLANGLFTKTSGSIFANFPQPLPSFLDIVALLDENGNVILTRSSYQITLCKGSDVAVYFVSYQNNIASFDVLVKRLGKIFKYQVTFNTQTNVFDCQSVIEFGCYDKMFLGIDNDYFVVKDNQLLYHKLTNE